MEFQLKGIMALVCALPFNALFQKKFDKDRVCLDTLAFGYCLLTTNNVITDKLHNDEKIFCSFPDDGAVGRHGDNNGVAAGNREV